MTTINDNPTTQTKPSSSQTWQFALTPKLATRTRTYIRRIKPTHQPHCCFALTTTLLSSTPRQKARQKSVHEPKRWRVRVYLEGTKKHKPTHLLVPSVNSVILIGQRFLHDRNARRNKEVGRRRSVCNSLGQLSAPAVHLLNIKNTKEQYIQTNQGATITRTYIYKIKKTAQCIWISSAYTSARYDTVQKYT